MPATMQSISAITKERYEGKLRKQLDEETVALKRIVKTNDGVTSDVGGKYVTFPIHVSRNQGIGARAEGEALPPRGQQGTVAARIGLKYLYGGMELTGQTLALANSNAEAFLSALELETDGLKNDVAKDQNRQVYGTGLGGFATVVSAAGNVLTLNTIQFIQDGMQVDLMDVTSTAAVPVVIASDRKVLSIDEANKTVTLSGAVLSPIATAGDFLTRFGNYNREWTGFEALFNNTTTLFNVDPAVTPVWKSIISGNGGTPRSISETLLITTVNKVRRAGGKTTLVITSPGVWTSYFNLLSAQRQFVNTKEFTGGFAGLAFATPEGEIPFVQDFDAPEGKLYGLNEKDLKVYRERDWSFMDRDGSMWERVSGYDAYGATLYQYSELGIGRRNTHFVITDVIETV